MDYSKVAAYEAWKQDSYYKIVPNSSLEIELFKFLSVNQYISYDEDRYLIQDGTYKNKRIFSYVSTASINVSYGALNISGAVQYVNYSNLAPERKINFPKLIKKFLTIYWFITQDNDIYFTFNVSNIEEQQYNKNKDLYLGFAINFFIQN